MWVFLNDRFVRKEEALVSVFDHGFLYGDGVYETLRSYGTRIFMRDQHLARLRRSAEAIGLDIPIPESHWPELLHEAMRRLTRRRGNRPGSRSVPAGHGGHHGKAAPPLSSRTLTRWCVADRRQHQAESARSAVSSD